MKTFYQIREGQLDQSLMIDLEEDEMLRGNIETRKHLGSMTSLGLVTVLLNKKKGRIVPKVTIRRTLRSSDRFSLIYRYVR